MALPKAISLDKTLSTMQVQWAAVLDPIIKTVKQLSTQKNPVLQTITSGSGTYSTPIGTQYLDVKIISAAGGYPVFGTFVGNGTYSETIINDPASAYSYAAGSGQIVVMAYFK